MAATPRPTKRRRTTGPNDAVQLDRNASVEVQERVDDSDDDDDNNRDLDSTRSALDKGKAKATDQNAPGEGTALPDLEEMERIYDMLAEEYHDIVSEMPIEYQRTFLLMRELEDHQVARTSDFKSALQDYITSTVSNPPLPFRTTTGSTSATPSAAPSPTASTSASTTATDEPAALRAALVGRDRLLKIAELATGAVRAGEDKVGLAITLYQTVDRHIQRLDADLARYEDSLVIGLRDGTVPSHDAPSAMRKSPPGPTTSLAAIALGEKEAYANGSAGAAAAAAAGAGPGAGRARRGGAAGDDGSQVVATAAGGARSTRKKPQRTAEDLEKEREWKRRKELLKHERAQKKREEESGMPIDPNEPLYCYCNRVSFGEMIACENEDCDREWFHLECVGLDKAPEGQWYCDDCVEKLDIDPVTMEPR